jgi:hypothetical protein
MWSGVMWHSALSNATGRLCSSSTAVTISRGVEALVYVPTADATVACMASVE